MQAQLPGPRLGVHAVQSRSIAGVDESTHNYQAASRSSTRRYITHGNGASVDVFSDSFLNVAHEVVGKFKNLSWAWCYMYTCRVSVRTKTSL